MGILSESGVQLRERRRRSPGGGDPEQRFAVGRTENDLSGGTPGGLLKSAQGRNCLRLSAVDADLLELAVCVVRDRPTVWRPDRSLPAVRAREWTRLGRVKGSNPQ